MTPKRHTLDTRSPHLPRALAAREHYHHAMMRMFARSVVVLAAVLALGASCKKKEQEAQPLGSSTAPSGTAAAEPPLELIIAYGSEKKTWLESELARWNESQPRLASGRPVRAVGKPMGSGEAMEEILAGGSSVPHVYSPASSAYLAMLNEAWQSRPGNLRPLAAAGEPLVLSPLVIAIWKPMAEALGWPEKELGWRELLAVARDPKGWESFGRPEWGDFKLGHTSPELSTSGLLSVLAIAAAAGEQEGPAPRLTAAAVADPKVKAFLGSVEDAVVHYGKSTGFFAEKMMDRGPSYLSAAVVYENLVIESYQRSTAPELPLVALYPREGTFWTDHPYAVLEAPWVTAEHKEAAALLGQALRARPQQERAIALGFRAADPAIPIGAPIDAAHGVDPKQPQNLLEVPEAPVLRALVELWKISKKASDVVLVFDKSGSMRGPPLAEAKLGAKAFLSTLDPRDRVTLLFFDGRVYAPIGPLEVGSGRAELESRIDGVVAQGGTALYDAMGKAVELMSQRSAAGSRRIRAVLAMTDGIDENSRTKVEALRARLGAEESPVIVFTVAYGDAADAAVLGSLADAGRGAFAKGDVSSIIGVFRDLAAYF